MSYRLRFFVAIAAGLSLWSCTATSSPAHVQAGESTTPTPAQSERSFSGDSTSASSSDSHDEPLPSSAVEPTLPLTRSTVATRHFDCPLDGKMGRSGDRPGCFDFYVFQMTWRPTFCASHASYDECRDLATNRHAPLWGVHGLWPQYRQGWPETCDASPGCQDDAVCPLDRRGLPSPLVAALQAVMPGYPDLADHEWRKHGTCTGLNQIEYFEAIVTTVDALKLSKAIEKDADQKMSVREIQDATGSPAAILTCEAGPYNEQTLLAMTTCWKIGENASVGERMSCPANVLPKQRCRGGRPIAVPRPAGHVGPIEENDTQDSDSTATVDQSSETTDDKSAAPSRCKSPAQGPECSIDADCPAHGYSRCAKRSKCCTR